MAVRQRAHQRRRFILRAQSGVVAPALESVAIDPSQPVVAIGSTTQLKAIATFDDGSVKDVTADFGWQSSDMRTVAANESGVVSGLASGPQPSRAAIREFRHRLLQVALSVRSSGAVPSSSLRVALTPETGRVRMQNSGGHGCDHRSGHDRELTYLWLGDLIETSVVGASLPFGIVSVWP